MIMIAITGATGKTGRELCRILLRNHKKVRAISRDAGKLRDLQKEGAELSSAEIFSGDVADVRIMTRAFQDVEAVYMLIPPDSATPDLRAYQNRIGEALASALKNAGVRYVVNLSSVGAQHAEGNGPVNGLHDQELRLNDLADVNVLHLRPAYFMENLLGQMPLIKQMGFFSTPIPGDHKFPMIASRDISSRAAERLMKLDFTGKQYVELQGQRDLSLNEVARVFGNAIGRKDLRYIESTPEDTLNGLLGMGLSRSVAASYVELALAISTGHCAFTQPRSPENSTPTSIEEFAEVFKAAYSR
jgi:uncharacterized protein YbjT (DUF2867 family)